MTKKELLNNIKRSSTIINVVNETKQGFEVSVIGTIKEPPVSTTKQILEAFIIEQRKFNKLILTKVESNSVKIDKLTTNVESNTMMIKSAHPELF